MRVLACAFCFLVLGVCGEGLRAKEVEVHHLSGTVVDENGHPVAEAEIAHAGQKLGEAYTAVSLETDDVGRFSVKIYSPAIVIRKAGYKSIWLRAENGDGIKVQLESLAKSGQSFAACAGPPLADAQKGGMRFKLPESKELKSSTGSDVDYSEQFFRLKGVRGKNVLVHGWRPTWSFGIPLDNDVWESTVYEERVFNMDPVSLLDARGALANGKRWRVVATFGETLGYHNVDQKAATAFDAILDRTCFER